MGREDRRANAQLGTLAAVVHLAAVVKLAAVALLFAAARTASADAFHLVFEPDRTEIRFEVDATLNSVRGSFRLAKGELHFDDRGGAVSGLVVIDAASGETGNWLRDDHMHESVLESARFPAITLLPESLEVDARPPGALRGRLRGRIEILGDMHPVVIPFEAERIAPDRARLEGHFEVPYVAWGLTDVSNFVLRVGKVVTLRLEAEGRLRGP